MTTAHCADLSATYIAPSCTTLDAAVHCLSSCELLALQLLHGLPTAETLDYWRNIVYRPTRRSLRGLST